MQNLLDFLRRWNFAFVFVVLEAVSLSLLFHYNTYQSGAWLTAANGFIATVEDTRTSIEQFCDLRTVNKGLTEENVRLQAELNELREEITDLKHDPALTEKVVLEKLKRFKMVPARVVSNTMRDRNNFLVINKGRKDGLQPEMGVVGGGGVVGITYRVGPHYSLVMPLVNPMSSVSCRVRGEGHFGYLMWEDDNDALSAYLEEIPRYAQIKKNSVIETSGFSAIFPPGLFVGRVTEVKFSEDAQNYRLRVKLGTDFSNIRDVMVIATPYKAEVDTLQKAITQ